jgi:hypothetical protein
LSDTDAGQFQTRSQYSGYRSGIKPNVLGVWWMGFAALQSNRQVQLLAQMSDDAVDLIVCHVLLTPCLPEAILGSI